jgi:hypothetical protein
MIKTLAASFVLIGSLALSARADHHEAKPDAKAQKPAKAAKAPKAKRTPAKEQVKALDADKDGSIDKAELEAYKKAVTESKDKDGKAMDEKTAAEARASLDAEFTKLDDSKDGKIDAKEFADDEAAAPAKK